MADTWQVINNSLIQAPALVAAGDLHGTLDVFLPATWQKLQANVRRRQSTPACAILKKSGS